MVKDYLSKDRTLRFKGILCLIVLFAHSNDGFICAYGLWAVAVFFFLSGYALSLTTHDKPLSAGMVFRKFRNFLLPFIIIAIPYHIMFHFYPCIYDYNSVLGTLKYLFLFYPTVQAGWYIVTLTFLFAFYFIALKFSKGSNTRLLVIMTALYVIYAVYALVFAHAEWAVQNAHMFILGVWFNLYRDRFETFFKGRTVLGYILLFVSYLSVVIPLFCYENESFLAKAGMFVFYNMSVVLFLYFAYSMRPRDPVTAFFGKYSLWIYLIHVGIQYLLMNILPLWGLKVEWKVYTFFLATLAVTVVLSLIIGIPYNFLMKKLSGKKTS